MTADYLIVGAGLFGATVARELMDAGKSVLVIDRRNHIGGNCYTEVQDGIIYNVYGGHIFHTHNKRIWEYASRFTNWQQYEHRVKAQYLGTIYSFPPNKMTLQQMDLRAHQNIEAEIRCLFFKGYTEKQWGRKIDEVPAHILKRIPIRNNWDDRYFDDPYQGLPLNGYTPMIQQMLKGAKIELEADYLDERDYWRSKAARVIYTGPLDELYSCDLGRLEYRSLRFELKRHEVSDFQGCAAINYTDKLCDFTRRIEWKYWWRSERKPYTLVTTEWPQAYDGTNEPYYPVGDEPNRNLHHKYLLRAKKDGYIIGGRLGSYQYLNMDQAIGAGLTLALKLKD